MSSLHKWQDTLAKKLLHPLSPPELRSNSEQKEINSGRVSAEDLFGDKNQTPLCDLSLYNELMTNTVAETLESIYPVSVACIRQFLNVTFKLQKPSEPGLNTQPNTEPNTWFNLVNDYRRQHPNPHYKLREAVRYFPVFLAAQPPLMGFCPFLSDLAAVEWAEVAVYNTRTYSGGIEQKVMKPDKNLDTVTGAELAALAESHTIVWQSNRQILSLAYDVPALMPFLSEQLNASDQALNKPQSWVDWPAVFAALASQHKKPLQLLVYLDETIHPGKTNLLVAASKHIDKSQTHLDTNTASKTGTRRLNDPKEGTESSAAKSTVRFFVLIPLTALLLSPPNPVGNTVPVSVQAQIQAIQQSGLLARGCDTLSLEKIYAHLADFIRQCYNLNLCLGIASIVNNINPQRNDVCIQEAVL